MSGGPISIDLLEPMSDEGKRKEKDSEEDVARKSSEVKDERRKSRG